MSSSVITDETILTSIAAYLQSLAESGSQKFDVEALEVATQCVQELNPSSPITNQRSETQNDSFSLKQIFSAGISYLKNNATTERCVTPESNDQRFQAWVQTLAEKGYFNGAEDGSNEYATRFAKAEQKWNEKYAGNSTATIPVVDKAAAEACKTAGNTSLQQGQYREAIAHYCDAIAFDPDNAVFFSNRAAAYMKLGEYANAVTDCEKAVEIDSSYTKGHYRLGMSLIQLNRSEDALASLKTALTTCNDSSASIADDIRRQISLLEPSPSTEAAPPMGFDFASMMNNPMMQGMAQQMMQNPDMMGSMFGSLGMTNMPPSSSQSSTAPSQAPTSQQTFSSSSSSSSSSDNNTATNASASDGGGNPLANLMNPAMMTALLESPQAQALERDPDVAPLINALRTGGPMAALPFLGNPSVMTKLQNAFQEYQAAQAGQ